MTSIQMSDPGLRAFFEKFDVKLAEIFNEPLSSYEEMMARSVQYLNFSI